MKIHEYQAKAILARYGVTTPRGEVANRTSNQVVADYRRNGSSQPERSRDERLRDARSDSTQGRRTGEVDVVDGGRVDAEPL